MAIRLWPHNALAGKVSGDLGNNKVAAKGKDKDKTKTPKTPAANTPPREFGGAKGPDPTRYGDWQHKGRCSDF